MGKSYDGGGAKEWYLSQEASFEREAVRIWRTLSEERPNIEAISLRESLFLIGSLKA